MKTIENITLYRCDFCKKEMKRKHSMANHETKCSSNPENHRACLNGCKHLVRKEIEYDTGYDNYHTGEPTHRGGSAFYCELKNIFMLHPKLEHKENGLYLKYVYFEDKEIEQELMPKECESYNDDIFSF